MGKFKLTVFVTWIAAGVLAAATLASTSASTISLKSTGVGNVLVGANGRTPYLFTADKGPKSVCYGQCATCWPPLIAGKPTAGKGLKASLLGTTKRKDGKLQVTYDGHPLYFFVRRPATSRARDTSTSAAPGGSSLPRARSSRRSRELFERKEAVVKFLVEFEVEVPNGTPESEVERGTRAEAAAAAKHANEGHLLRLWKRNAVADDTTAIGIYAAESDAELDRLLRALPLTGWMQVTIVPLAPHPNDPGAGSVGDTAADARPKTVSPEAPQGLVPVSR
jgi:muconolactone delta-isomerase